MKKQTCVKDESKISVNFKREKNPYFETFRTKDGNLYGLRIGVPKDAEEISQIYKEIYQYDYLDPVVYDIHKLKKSLSNENKYWFIGVAISEEENEIFGSGLMEKQSESTLYASKAVIKHKYRKKGLASKLTASGILTLLRRPKFQNVFRLDADIRSKNIHAQKLFRNIKAIPYCFNPMFYNYGDRRDHNFSKDNPFCKGKTEPATLHVFPLSPLWKKRENSIILFENEDLLFMYNYVKSMTQKMRNDKITLKTNETSKIEHYKMEFDLYKGILNIRGYLKEKTLLEILDKYRNWRCIDWRVPTTLEGLKSIKNGFKHDFKIIGYDIASYSENQKLYHDCVVLANFPNKIDFKNIKDLHLLPELEPLVYRVLDILDIKKRK